MSTNDEEMLNIWQRTEEKAALEERQRILALIDEQLNQWDKAGGSMRNGALGALNILRESIVKDKE